MNRLLATHTTSTKPYIVPVFYSNFYIKEYFTLFLCPGLFFKCLFLLLALFLDQIFLCHKEPLPGNAYAPDIFPSYFLT
ncbi:hypothetical protein [Wolbachia endosymbiont (group A) of Lasioglossum fulvicorne]|uniref:hypothetical protein n=1 Tax=Wolbachia endosymbiont (group A) of Lasioglossum fulvicorne TaxID=3066201 RepID=UPI003342BFAD